MEKEIKLIRQADFLAFAQAKITEIQIGTLTSKDIPEMISSLSQMLTPIICDFCRNEVKEAIVLCEVDVDCYYEDSDEKIIRDIQLCEGCVSRMSLMFSKPIKNKTK